MPSGTMLPGRRLRYASGVVKLVDGEPYPDRWEVHGLRGSVNGTLPDTSVGTRVDLDLALVLRDQHVLAERRDLLIVLALLPSIVGFRALAEHLDDDDRVRHVGRRRRIADRIATDHRRVRVGREAGGDHTDPQIGAVRPARPAFEPTPENEHGGCRQGCVLRRPACHREDLAVEKFMTDGAHLLDAQVVLERVVARRNDHARSTLPPPPGLAPPGIGRRRRGGALAARLSEPAAGCEPT